MSVLFVSVPKPNRELDSQNCMHVNIQESWLWGVPVESPVPSLWQTLSNCTPEETRNFLSVSNYYSGFEPTEARLPYRHGNGFTLAIQLEAVCVSQTVYCILSSVCASCCGSIKNSSEDYDSSVCTYCTRVCTVKHVGHIHLLYVFN